MYVVYKVIVQAAGTLGLAPRRRRTVRQLVLKEGSKDGRQA